MKRSFLVALFTIACIASEVLGLGITVSPGDYALDNLKIGQVYDVSKMGQPLSVRYRGGKQMDISVTPAGTTTPAEGYEVIPDTSWVTIDRMVAPALPGETVEFNIVIAIPNDEKYMGKKYDARLNCALVPVQEPGTMGVVPGAQVRILMSVSGKAASSDEIEKLGRAIQKTRNISLSPAEMYLENVPLGKRINIKKDMKKSIKVANVNDETVRLKMTCQPASKAGLKINGYDEPPNADMLKISKDSVKLRGNQIEEVFLYLNIPDKPEFRNKKYIFVVDATVEGEVLRTQFRSRVMITTEP